MALRNLEEQVLYLTNELIKIKQSLGTALPDPIEGPEGPEGPEGQRGEQGEQGFGIVGFGTQLPSSGRNGDWFLLKKSTMTGIDFVMCRCISQHWVEQFSIRGPAGPIANVNEVVANPEGEPNDTIDKIEIDGVIYSIYQSLLGKFVKIVDAPDSTTLTDEQIELFREGCFINGTFLGLRNAIFIPCEYNYDGYYGIVIGNNSGLYSGTIRGYRIDGTTKVIALYNYKSVRLDNIEQLNGVVVPNYPNYPLNRKILSYGTDNTLSWIDEPTAGMAVYRHSISLATPYSGFSFVIGVNILSTDNVAYTTLDEVWNKIGNEQTIMFGGKLAVIKNFGGAGMEIAWVDDPNTTINISKASTTFTSDSISSI